MNIMYVISSLSPGGAERVLSSIANEFASRENNVTIVTICKSEIFYEINLNIKLIQLDLCGVSKNIFQALYRNYKIIKTLHQVLNDIKPDIIISFMNKTNIYTLLAQYNCHYKTIISERVDATNEQMNVIFHLLRKILYKKANMLVSVSKGVDSYFHFLPKTKRHIIYNPIKKDIMSKGQEVVLDVPKKYIIAVGRLYEQKGYDKMLLAFSQIKTNNYKLLIFGDGPLKEKIEKYITKLEISEKVKLMGTVKNIYPYMQKAQFLVLSSKYEGFPNVLIEAMSCGCPVVSFDCPSGPKEIIEHEKNGLLIEDQNSKELTKAMQRLMSDEFLRDRLSKEALKVQEKYNIQKITNEWEEVMKKVIKQ